MPRVKIGWFERTTVVLGVGLVLLMVGLEARTIATNQTPGSGGEDAVTALRSAETPSGVPDRVQLLVAVFPAAAVSAPTELYQRVVPFDEIGEEPRSFQVGSRDLRLRIARPNRAIVDGPSGLADLNIRLDLKERPFGESMHQNFGVTGKTVDMGDARPFYDVGITLRGAPPVAIVSRHQPRFEVMARALYASDATEPMDAPTAARHIGRSVRTQPPFVFLAGRVDELPDFGVARLLADANGFGLLLLINGLVFCLYHRLNFVRGTVALATLLIVMLSASARIDAAVQRARLSSSDPDTRLVAAERLARGHAFAPTAAEAIVARFDAESDASMRAGLVLAAIHDGVASQRSLPIGEMIVRAAKDPSEAVRSAAELARDARQHLHAN